MATPRPRRTALAGDIVLPLAGLAALIVHVISIRPWMLDDAFVFFRYAENWVAGHGPVFNPGERVEGYTSFLWLALVTAGRALGGDPVRVAHFFGWIGALGSLLLVVVAARWVPELPRRAGLIAALWLGTAGWFTAWTESGMEVMLAASLLTIAALLDARGARGFTLGLLLGGFTLVRPEGLLVFVVFLALAGWEWVRIRQSGAAPGRPPVLLLLGFVLVVGTHLAWRLATYEAWLPNTYYARSGWTPALWARGLSYAGKFALVAAPLIVALAWLPKSFPGRFGRLVPALLASWGSIVVLEGGDAMPAFRFFAPTAPLLCLAAAVVVARRLRPMHATLAALAIAGFNVAVTRWVRDIDPRLRHDRVAYGGLVIGDWMRQRFPPDHVIATNTAGSLPYASKLRVIDMLGLTDAHIARRRIEGMGTGQPGHEKHDGAYVLARQPEWIQFGSVRGSVEPGFPGDHEIAASPEFARYRLEQFEVMIGGWPDIVSLYRREDVPRP